MCGRFTVSQPKRIHIRFKTSNKLPLFAFKPSWNIAPSQIVPVIIRNSPNRVVLMKWGLIWNRGASSGTINLRSESFKEKPFFGNFLLNKRCLIIADSFYEWGNVNLEGKIEKYPFNFYLPGRKLFGFAGVYSDFLDAEGKDYYTCAIITCPANKLVKKIHRRMPVIIKKGDEDFWLNEENKDFERLFDLLKPYPEKEMRMNIVSKKVNNPANDGKELIKKEMYTFLKFL